jgi:hypothetical protein
MRKIGLDNYEEFFLDYSEGNLSAQELDQLNSFLILHPDLKEALEDFELFSLEKEPVSFKDKEYLKKQNEISYIESLLIGKVEKDLSGAEEKQLKQLLNDRSELYEEIKSFEKTFLAPDHLVVYPHKRQLKKIPVLRRIYIPLSVAAFILMVIGVYFYSGPSKIVREYSNQPAKRSLNPIVNLTPVLKEEPIISPTEPIRENVVAKDIKLIALRSLSAPEKVNYEESVFTVTEPPLPQPIEEEIIAVNNLSEEFKTLPELAKEISKNKLEQLISPDSKDILIKKDRSLWDYASAGINGVGRLTGLNLRVEAQKDSLGNTVSTTFIAGSFQFARSKGR